MSLFSNLTLRAFKTIAPAKAAQPADICTTVPPAKSNAPILNKKPSGCQVQCAIGAYTNKLKSAINKTYAVKRILSATAPTTNPGVIMANINWNTAKRVKGIVGARLHGAPEATFLKNRKVVGLPMIPLTESPKHKLNPTTTHKIL